jgi:hypothetical protein
VDNENILTRHPGATRVEMAPENTSIAFGFQVLDFYQSGRNLAEYKLEGFDEGWTRCTDRCFARYDNLKGGRYTFRVRGANRDRVWNMAGPVVEVIVPQRFYETNWFPAAMLGIVFILHCLSAALCLQLIAGKTGTPCGWFAWIPVLNILLMCRVAAKPAWWTLLCFLPVVNVVVFIMLWWILAKAVGRPGWYGVVIVLIPLVGLVFLGLLAFSRRQEVGS